MLRLLMAGAVFCLLVLFAVSGIGRALDHEAQDRVIFTRAGVTLDCARTVGPYGSVAYTECHQVP